KMFGYDSKDEMISTHPVHLYESKSDRDALFMRIMSQGKVLNALIHYRKKDGSFFWGNLNCQRVMENGEDYLIGTIVDVTLQQEQTRLLEESEKQLREAQRLAKLGNWRVAPNEKTMEWSAECARIHGFLPSSTENAFDQWVDRLEDISFEEILDGLKKFAAMNRDFEFGSWYKTPNGERRYLYYICRLEESKSAYSWYGTVQDNTVLKNQEEELISTREFYQNILDSIPVEALLIAADKSFYYISKNAIGDDELRSWMIGKTNIDYVKRRNLPLDIAEQRNEMIERAFNGNLTVRWEEKMITRDGRDSYHLRNVIPIDLKIGDEEKRFLIVYSFDINDIKSAQFRLERKNDELEKLNKELDRFVYSISHDLRAPIASVLGLNALAEECEDNEEMESLLAMQREALDRLDRYIRDVIDYARNKRLDITPKHLSIAALIEECMTDLAYLNNYSEIEFFIDVEDDCSVFSDQVRVKIILNNLLSNAIKYIDHSKEKCIVSIKAKKIDGILHLEVTDNGIGIKEEFQDQIWEIFFRAISDVPGSGLGLYILKESIKNLKGSIDLESEEGKGTGFFLKIPDFEA
ncbi:MAG: PAS domain-containing sensor histidine kinase, partial [Salibacteraceae bacterium]